MDKTYSQPKGRQSPKDAVPERPEESQTISKKQAKFLRNVVGAKNLRILRVALQQRVAAGEDLTEEEAAWLKAAQAAAASKQSAKPKPAKPDK